jgi:hypothetical protein
MLVKVMTVDGKAIDIDIKSTETIEIVKNKN